MSRVDNATLMQGRAARMGRALASPTGVLITLPLLVVAVGVGILLVGRDATRSASTTMARHQLSQQAKSVQEDVAFALDQASPVLAQLAALADRDHPLDDVLLRMYGLIVGRPGIAFVSVSFPDGTFRGASLAVDGSIELQESRPGEVVHYFAEERQLRFASKQSDTFDPRQRPYYAQAVRVGARVWTEPYTFFHTHDTGITCGEPLYDSAHALRAVITVDFNVRALSSYVARPALDQARSLVFTRDGIVLAYPSADRLEGSKRDKLLRREDLHDPAVDALLAQPLDAGELRLFDLATKDGDYLASVAPIGGRRAGVAVPLDWFVATIVPSRTLFEPSDRFQRRSIIASAGALASAVGLALVLAWNLLRMRRQVVKSQEEARSAQARARELGSYRLVARLGKGGMGEVWRAEHRMLARSAAIKLIRPETMPDPRRALEMRERFRREAQVLASMKSRHTIAIFDYGVTNDGVFYYVMELLDGLDLEALVRRNGGQPAARVIEILIQACASLAEAHDAGLYHRDIKPPNLMLCRAADEVDIIKLLDFGIVHTPNEQPREPNERPPTPQLGMPGLTQLGAMVGTPGFMAPEQIFGMPLDGRADLYSLGCVAWWLLTGHEVFQREGGDAKVLHRHVSEEVPSLRARVAGWLPRELEAILMSCLAKDVDGRPRDARSLAALLRTIEVPPEHAWHAVHAGIWWRDFRAPEPVAGVPSTQVEVALTSEPGDTRVEAPRRGGTAFDAGDR
jgi:serine/threonine protein kinase